MPDNALKFTVAIVSSYLGKHRTSGTDLTTLIRTVHTALTTAAAPPPVPAPPQAPAVSARRSVTPDAILCMDCGKAFKSLRRHLSTDHDQSAEAYREKWGLPKTYPMVAPAYSAARSALAKSIGLGSRRDLPLETVPAAELASAAPVAFETAEEPPPPPRKARARPATQPKSRAARPKGSKGAKAIDLA